jgi:tetratricopeptide (TPR) repeat protein
MWVLAVLLFLQAPDYIADGLKALDAKDYPQAAQLFAKAVAADPKDYAAHFHLALADSMLQHDTEAAAEYQQVLALKPGLFEAQLNLGILLIRDKEPADALPLLSAASQQKPAEFRPRLYWAQALLDTGDAPAAEDQYKRALELNAKSAAAELGLARAQAKQNRLADAAAHFRAAATADPNFKDALLELADLYEQAHQGAYAIAVYQQFPDNPAAQEHLGRLMLEANRSDDAIAPLEAAVHRDPTPANRLALATAYVFAKQYDKAMPLLSDATAADPSNYSLHMMYGRALRDSRHYDPAAQQFLLATRIQANSMEAWKELAGMLYMIEKYPESLAALDHAHQAGDDSPANYYFHALTYDRLRVLKPALENYREFLARSNGKFPDEEWKARQRAKLIERELSKR